MQDFKVVDSDFAATTLSIYAISDAAVAFFTERMGLKCHSIEVTKSNAPFVADQLVAAGFTIQ